MPSRRFCPGGRKSHLAIMKNGAKAHWTERSGQTDRVNTTPRSLEKRKRGKNKMAVICLVKSVKNRCFMLLDELALSCSPQNGTSGGKADLASHSKSVLVNSVGVVAPMGLDVAK
ncbi:hypothetical protein CBS470a_001668 [Colletotrichum nupharicola]|nr:hypothetical protein CBS470a_001668 [Colletotrichum nupharicola]